MQSKGQASARPENSWAEKFRPIAQVDHMDTFGGPIDRDGLEVEEAGKGNAFRRDVGDNETRLG